MKINNGFYDLIDNYDATIFFDTETTGTNAEGKDELGQQIQIVELAARRLEKDENGQLHITRSMDDFIKMPEGRKLPPSIVEFNRKHGTGIDDKLLETKGITESEACTKFEELAKGNVLLVAYNAQFDLCMVREMLARSGNNKELMDKNDVLDPLTILKSIKPYSLNEAMCKKEYPNLEPSQLSGHRLETALLYYHIEDEFQNSHRAIDDCDALIGVTQQVSKSEGQYKQWINVIGYNPKYSLQGKQHPKVKYFGQYYL